MPVCVCVCVCVTQVTKVLDDINVGHQIFYHVSPDPTLECINEGLKEILEFRPDVIIAMGGGSPMDAAKVRARGIVCVCLALVLCVCVCDYRVRLVNGKA